MSKKEKQSFGKDAVIRNKKIVKNPDGLTVVDGDGVIKSNVAGVIFNGARYDGRQFFKVYRMGVRAISMLSLPAIRVLMYMINNCYCDNEKPFSARDCMEYTGYKSRSYVYKAMKELYQFNVIMKKRKGLYRINPNMFYNKSTIKK